MALKELIFNSFFFGGVVVLKELIFNVSTLRNEVVPDRTDF